MSLAASLLNRYLQQLQDQRMERVSLTPLIQQTLLKTVQRPVLEKAISAIDKEASKDSRSFSLKAAYRDSLQELPKAFPADSATVALPVKKVPASSPIVMKTIVTKAEALEKLKAVFAQDKKLRQLETLRGQAVFSTGNAEAEIMFIGEAPGAEEEKLQEPFVGPAGQTLTKIIQAMGLRRQEVYISNICKFRPKMGDGIAQGTKNRPPSVEEMQSCLSYVLEEISIVQPKIIVALGATAANGLGIEGSVGKLRGSMQEFQGIPVVVTYHPSYLLRKEQDDGGGIAEKRLVWEDMMAVMEFVGIPVSPKQRAYFSKGRG